jgi:hypothetical protein
MTSVMGGSHRTKREQREEFDISIKIFIEGAGGQKV